MPSIERGSVLNQQKERGHLALVEGGTPSFLRAQRTPRVWNASATPDWNR